MSHQQGLALATRENAQTRGLGVRQWRSLSLSRTLHKPLTRIYVSKRLPRSSDRKRRPATRQVWSLSKRLSDAQRLAIVDAYRSGATATRLAAIHDLSLSSLKRILRSGKATKIST